MVFKKTGITVPLPKAVKRLSLLLTPESILGICTLHYHRNPPVGSFILICYLLWNLLLGLSGNVYSISMTCMHLKHLSRYAHSTYSSLASYLE